MDYKSLRVEISDYVAEVVLCGPTKGNAMGPDFWREVPFAFRELDRNEHVRCVILRADGDHFSYGLDLPGMMGTLGPLVMGNDGLAAQRNKMLTLIEELQDAFNAIERCRKPVIAAVHGWCIGGGVDMIAACDVRMCSADAKFSVREVKLAMVADLGSLQRLPRIIGQGHTRELAFSGKNIDAAHAARIHLVNNVYSSRDELLAAARDLAREIAANSPITVQGIKQVLGEGERAEIDAGLRHVAVWNAAFIQSADLGEAISAWMEKRTPTFR